MGWKSQHTSKNTAKNSHRKLLSRVEYFQAADEFDWFMSWRISITFQQVVRSPSFIGFGKRPDFTPSHHVDLLTGITGGIPFFLSPIICDSLTRPVSGRIL